MDIHTAGNAIGELAVWRIINPPNEPTLYPVKTPDEAVRMIDAMAQVDLENEDIWANMFGLMEWDGTEWTEWFNENGADIDEYGELVESGDL